MSDNPKTDMPSKPDYNIGDLVKVTGEHAVEELLEGLREIRKKLDGGAMVTNRQHEKAFGAEYALNQGNKAMVESIRHLDEIIKALVERSGAKEVEKTKTLASPAAAVSILPQD